MAKYCAKCNKFFEDEGIGFCSECGSSEFVPAPADSAPVEEKPVEQTPVETPAAEVTPVEQTPATPAPAPQQPYAQPQAPYVAPQGYAPQPGMPAFNQMPATQPKKKGSGLKVLAVLAIVVILIVGIVFVFSFAKNLFMSDASYFEKVEKKSISDSLDTFTKYYDGYLIEDGLRDNAYNVKFSTVLGDDLKTLIKESYGDQLKIDWLDETEFDYTVNSKGNKMAQDLLIAISGQHVLSTSVLYNYEDSKMLVLLKEVSDDVFAFDMEQTSEEANEVVETFSADNRQLALDSLPKSSIVRDLVTKYHTMIIESIEDVTKTTEEVTIDGVTQKLTVLQANVDKKTLQNITLALLEEVKKDKDIKKIIDDVEKACEKQGITDEVLTYADFISEVDELISLTKAEETTEDQILTIYDYVGSGDEIVGRKIVKDGSEILNYITVEDGNKFAATYDTKEGVSYKASGTKKGDLITGEYIVKEDDETLYKIQLTDFDEEAFKKGKLDGRISVVPNGEAVKELAPDEYKSLSSVMDVSFDITAKGDATSGSFDVAFKNGDKSLISLKGQYSINPSSGVKDLKGKVVDTNKLDDSTKLIKDLHIDQLIANLRKTSVPKEYVDYIDELNKQIKSMG